MTAQGSGLWTQEPGLSPRPSPRSPKHRPWRPESWSPCRLPRALRLAPWVRSLELTPEALGPAP
eukprot:6027627-Pyramimonas_sp.AAC.2